jgi:hypothetical protein
MCPERSVTYVSGPDRPHQALDMKCPVEVYTPSTRPYRGLPELDPFHDKTIHVTCCGRICLHRKKSISARCSRGRLSVSRRSKKVFGCQLYELRSWLRRSGGKNSATSRKPVWPKTVTHVAGTFCYSLDEARQVIACWLESVDVGDLTEEQFEAVISADPRLNAAFDIIAASAVEQFSAHVQHGKLAQRLPMYTRLK